MTLYNAGDKVADGGLWYGDDKVAVRWYGDDEVYRAGAAPPPAGDVTVEFDYTLVAGSASINVTVRGVDYAFTIFRARDAANDYMHFRFASAALANAARTAWGRVRVSIGGTQRYDGVNVGFQGFNWFIVIPRFSFTDSGTISMTFVAPVNTGNSITFTADFINAVAAGKFGGLVWQPTIKGQQYLIAFVFTHGNGHQIRPGSPSLAQAFKDANLLVDTGIAGQQPYRSSLMTVVTSIAAVQYVAFPGRYAANTEYTVTISE